MKFKNIVFAGCGKLVPAYLGVVLSLVVNGILINIENVAGTSSGALVSLMIGLGMTLEEMENALQDNDFKKYLDGGISHKIRTVFSLAFGSGENAFGIYSGDELKKFIKTLLTEKLGNSEATFSDFYQKMRVQRKNSPFFLRQFYAIGTNIKTKKSEVYSYYHTPDKRIVDAIYISMTFPGMLSPLDCSDENICIDGGVQNNFPIDLFDCDTINEQTLGFYIEPIFNEDTSTVKTASPILISDALKYLTQPWRADSNIIKSIAYYTSSILMSSIESQNYKIQNNYFRAVKIVAKDIPPMVDLSGTGFDLTISKDESYKLQEAGFDATEKFILNHQSAQIQNTLTSGQHDLLRLFKFDRKNIYEKSKSISLFELPNKSCRNIQIKFCSTLLEIEPQALLNKLIKYFTRLQRQPEITRMTVCSIIDNKNEFMIDLDVSASFAAELINYKTNNHFNFVNKKISTKECIVLKSHDRDSFLKPVWIKQTEYLDELYDLCEFGEIDLFIKKLSTFENILSDKLFYHDDNGNNICHKAAEYDRLEIMKILISSPYHNIVGTLLDSPNHFGEIPIHIASENGHNEMIKLILERKSKSISDQINYKEKFLRTPLHFGAWNNHTETVKLLLEYKAISSPDLYGNHPVHYASHLKYYDLVLILFQNIYNNDQILHQEKYFCLAKVLDSVSDNHEFHHSLTNKYSVFLAEHEPSAPCISISAENPEYTSQFIANQSSCHK